MTKVIQIQKIVKNGDHDDDQDKAKAEEPIENIVDDDGDLNKPVVCVKTLLHSCLLLYMIQNGCSANGIENLLKLLQVSLVDINLHN